MVGRRDGLDQEAPQARGGPAVEVRPAPDFLTTRQYRSDLVCSMERNKGVPG